MTRLCVTLLFSCPEGGGHRRALNDVLDASERECVNLQPTQHHIVIVWYCVLLLLHWKIIFLNKYRKVLIENPLPHFWFKWIGVTKWFEHPRKLDKKVFTFSIGPLSSLNLVNAGRSSFAVNGNHPMVTPVDQPGISDSLHLFVDSVSQYFSFRAEFDWVGKRRLCGVRVASRMLVTFKEHHNLCHFILLASAITSLIKGEFTVANECP